MLIIFDLDDTLIDTSGCITPLKLEDALKRMVEAGLDLPSFPEALEMLRRLDDSSESARHTLAEFLEINHIDNKFLDIGIKEVYGDLPPDLPVFARDQALEVLLELKDLHELALVTIGKPEQQGWKMKKAGIDSTIFSKLIVSEERNKKLHYQAIAEELGFRETEVVVCGDRIAIDLSPARELGFKTVHMRWGRGLNGSGPKSDVDYTITELAEMREIISGLMSFSSF